MSKFGWSYPAGCNGPPDQEEGPCEVCGFHLEDCRCLECPVCGEAGNPDCLGKHFGKAVTVRPGVGEEGRGG
jgi:hypothetical protein